jgi:oligoendopeptidase F
MSQVRFRDLIEDNWQKISSLRTQLRDLQTEENRRVREEASERWKKKLQDKAKEKARLEENKTNNLSGNLINKILTKL